MASQPQWPLPFPVRNYHYTHSQPQWSSDAIVCNRAALLPNRVCASCCREKQQCVCHTCAVCKASVSAGGRHHCRKCWRVVCASCWTRKRHVHMLASTERVCDDCAVPRALAHCCRPLHGGALSWGLYVLRRAADMPNVCVGPTCRYLTHSAVCPLCGMPTVTTRPHKERSVTINKRTKPFVSNMERQERAARRRVTLAYADGASEPEATFRASFPRYEELDAFASLTAARDAQDTLLAVVAASIAYEYAAAPSLTLALSDVTYARVLRVECVNPRYTILEAPGYVKFIAIPGTHDTRTVAVNLRCGAVVQERWNRIVGGVVVSDGSSRVIHGGMSKVWEYRVHDGFAREAEEMDLPIEELVEDIRKGYRLVLCGHSLGGAVAQLLALRLLHAHPGIMKDCLRCIALGAPLVGNYQLAQYVEWCGWRSIFHHFVYRSDLIPRLMCVDQITRDLADQLVKNAIAIPYSVQQWFNYSRKSTTPTTPTVAAAEEEEEEEAPMAVTAEEERTEKLARHIDTCIKQSRDLIEGKDEDYNCVGNHRIHRAYACFGRYHFLNHIDGVYYSTNDSEKAFHRLKEGCGGETRVGDHSVESYNRAIVLRLYSR